MIAFRARACVVSRRLSRQIAFGDFVAMLACRERPESGKSKSLLD